MDGAQHPAVNTTNRPPLSYTISRGLRDEALAVGGSVRPAWADIMESYQRHGPEGLRSWLAEATRLSRERGFAYRPDGSAVTDWKLDPIPWIVGEHEWQRISAGVAQRVRLYQAILSDLYGSQRLLKSGIVPAPILLGQPRYLRACHDIHPEGGTPGIGMVSVDLAKDRGGNHFAVDGHFDVPFGVGLALESRTVVNQVLPNLFRRCRTARLAPFFKLWFKHLLQLAPDGVEDPRVVILDREHTGVDSEKSFLANYCGIVRVIPSDLTVRGGKVWMKTLHGLEPVHVIWRAQEGINLDPIEVPGWTSFGVSGLLSAIRAGNVAVVGHPGGGALRTAGLYPFLPAICRELLDEDLLLPPVATWWCGGKKGLRYVLDHLTTMVIKDVAPNGTAVTTYGQRLSTEALAELRARISAEPGRYVGQEEIAISTIPSSTAAGLVPRGAVMRCFAFANLQGDAEVMPGGLGRGSAESGIIVSTRHAGICRDIWVQTSAPDTFDSLADLATSAGLRRSQVVPSRTAENLFWAGRNSERVEALARFADRIIQGREEGFSYGDDIEQRHEAVLVQSLCRTFRVNAKAAATDADPQGTFLGQFVGKTKSAINLGANLQFLRGNCLATRELWSPSSLLAIDAATGAWPKGGADVFPLFKHRGALQNLQIGLSAFLGRNLDSMTRDEGWVLLDAGRSVERIFFLVEILRHTVAVYTSSHLKTLLNESLLFVSDSHRTYQHKFHSIANTRQTLQLLLGEENYPRSLCYQLNRLDRHLSTLPEPAQGGHPHELVAPLQEALISFLNVLDFLPEDAEVDCVDATSRLDNWATQIADLNTRLTTAYFSHTPEPIQ